MIGSPAEARAQIDRDVERARERAVAAHAAKRAVDAVRGRAESRDGDVTVVVDAGGSIVTLDLTPNALSRRPQDLSHTIVQTTRRAQSEASTQVAAIAAATYGENSATTERIRTQLDAQFIKPDQEDGINWGSGGRR